MRAAERPLLCWMAEMVDPKGRQDVLRRLIDVGLCSDTPLQAAGPNATDRLYVHTQLSNARSRELAIARDEA